MAYDPEQGHGKADYLANEKDAEVYSNDAYSPEPVKTYQGTAVSQDGGIMSKLRDLEARMDRKLGVESEAIDRKRVSSPCVEPVVTGDYFLCFVSHTPSALLRYKLKEHNILPL
jgi:hypothetical protein